MYSGAFERIVVDPARMGGLPTIRDTRVTVGMVLGKGGRMMRLQPGRITEAALTFHKPGRYLMVCTVYCGEAHDLMQATIEVV